MNTESRYSVPEKLLMAWAALVFLLMSYVYVKDISIKRFFFPSAEDLALSTPIAKVSAITGSVLRQRMADFEFKTIGMGTDLFPNDTLMTGPDGAVTIELSDGRKFELGANSLVKLSFGSDFSLKGLVHIEVLKAPSVPVAHASAEPVVPKEVPLAISQLEPKAGTTLSFSVAEHAQRSKSVRISFRVNKKNPPRLTAQVYLGARGDQSRHELASSLVQVDGNEASTVFKFTAPGAYEWEIRDLSGNVLGRSSLEIGRRVPVLELLPTENNTNRLEGLATKKTFDGFLLRWKPLAGKPGSPYVVHVYDVKSGRSVLQKEMTATQLILNRNSLTRGTLQYAVERELPGGFLGVSSRQAFGFEFLAPEPTAPGPNAVFDSVALQKTNNLIFFTWSKTNYTEKYEFELSENTSFSHPLLQQSLKDNFKTTSPPRAGRYYWRVRAFSGGEWSQFSEPRALVIQE